MHRKVQVKKFICQRSTSVLTAYDTRRHFKQQHEKKNELEELKICLIVNKHLEGTTQLQCFDWFY